MNGGRILVVGGFRTLETALVGVLREVHIGSDIFVLKAQTYAEGDRISPSYECCAAGNNEGCGTGVVAAKVAFHIVEHAMPSGVFHLEQLVDPQEFLEELKVEGLSVYMNGLETAATPHSTLGELFGLNSLGLASSRYR